MIPLTQPTIYDSVKKEFHETIDQILDSKILSNYGPWCNQFEKSVEKYIGQGVSAVAFPSCDIALIATVSYSKKSKLSIPSFTFNSTANSLLWNNKIIEFCDINQKTFLTDKTDIITHTFGNPQLGNNKTIFDAAHAFGAKYSTGVPVGAEGLANVFSFSGTKPVTCGEGGVVTTKNTKLLKHLKYARNYGFYQDYTTKIKGLNGKISEINAAFASLMIKHTDNLVEKRRKIARRYRDLLGDTVDFQSETSKYHSYKDFAIIVNNPDSLKNYLKINDIQSKRYFKPLHRMKIYKSNKTLVNTDYVYGKILCIPIYSHMKEEEQDIVVKMIKKWDDSNGQ